MYNHNKTNNVLLKMRRSQVRHVLNFSVYTLYAVVLYLFARSFPVYPRLLLIVITLSLFLGFFSASIFVLITVRLSRFKQRFVNLSVHAPYSMENGELEIEDTSFEANENNDDYEEDPRTD